MTVQKLSRGLPRNLGEKKDNQMIELSLTHEFANYAMPLKANVMLRSGDAGNEEWRRETESDHKDKFRGWVGFSVAVSHRITAE
ncbi:Soluble starch synthase 1 [Nymphaea thermarum]|nr:Soluble starch synthase 1 [Nymphaea thermarum]